MLLAASLPKGRRLPFSVDNANYEVHVNYVPKTDDALSIHEFHVVDVVQCDLAAHSLPRVEVMGEFAYNASR